MKYVVLTTQHAEEEPPVYISPWIGNIGAVPHAAPVRAQVVLRRGEVARAGEGGRHGGGQWHARGIGEVGGECEARRLGWRGVPLVVCRR